MRTFAYFSVTANGESTTPIRVKTDAVGTIALATGTETPHLNLKAEDMTKTAAGEEGKIYYSTIGGSSDHEENATEHTFATVTLTGGETGTKYSCSATFTIKLTNDDGAEFQKGEAALHLTGENGVDLAGLSLESDEIDLTELSSEKTGTVTFKLTGNGTTVTQSIKGYLYVKNSNTEDQTTRLAGKEFSVTITGNTFKCDIEAAGE